VEHRDKFTLYSSKNAIYKFSLIKKHDDHASNQEAVKGRGSVPVTI
jgi:hypothetical protein